MSELVKVNKGKGLETVHPTVSGEDALVGSHSSILSQILSRYTENTSKYIPSNCLITVHFADLLFMYRVFILNKSKLKNAKF